PSRMRNTGRDVEVVRVDAFLVASRGPDESEHLLVRRTTVRVDRDAVPYPERGPEDTVAERMWDAVSDATSDRLVSPVWRRTECWRTPDFRGLADLAEGIVNVHQRIHEIVLGSPVRAAAGAAGAPAPAVGALTAVASALPLPGDATVSLITTVI